MSVDELWETTDVVICGCGPTGALLSAYLGRMGVHNIVLEREPEITTDPRGIALDDDGIRFLQGLGLYDAVYTKIGTCESPPNFRRTNTDSSGMGKFKFIGGTTSDMHTRPIFDMDHNTVRSINLLVLCTN